MKLIIAGLLFVAVRGKFTNNSTQDSYIQPEDRVYDPRSYVQPEVELTLYSHLTPRGFQIYPIDRSKVYPEEIANQILLPIPMKVFVHGYHSEGAKYENKYKLATNFLSLPGDDGNVNVIIVSWRSKRMLYKKAALRSMHVGEFLGQWLFKTVFSRNPNLDLHLIGHSLGAHAVGLTGRRLWQSDRAPRRVTGLDPAGPMFEWFKTDGLEMIQKDSGLFVDIIHTNPGVLGVKQQYGHLDFYVDGGYQNLRQFRGFREGRSQYRNKLSHSHATIMFIESILQPTKYVSLLCGRVNPTVNTLRNPICTLRPDGYAYRNFLGNGAVQLDIDQAYGTYIADLEEPALEDEIQSLEGLDMDDGMETDSAMQ